MRFEKIHAMTHSDSVVCLSSFVGISIPSKLFREVSNSSLTFSQFLLAAVGMTFGDVSHILDETTSTTYPPRPYAFSYEAGRYHNGHVDRN
jgi:hypothetical protein